MDDEAVRVFSKGMAGFLRHNHGGALPVGPDGFVPVEALVSAINGTKRPGNFGMAFDGAVLAEVVARDGKGRFEMAPDGRSVRAVSGHSFPVDLGQPAFVPDGPLYFGTVADRADAIEADGMTASRKLMVRLCRGYDEALAIAESRGCGGPVVFEVDAPRLAADGHAFTRAPNGEILTGKFGPGYVTRLAPAPRGP